MKSRYIAVFCTPFTRLFYICFVYRSPTARDQSTNTSTRMLFNIIVYSQLCRLTIMLSCYVIIYVLWWGGDIPVTPLKIPVTPRPFNVPGTLKGPGVTGILSGVHLLLLNIKRHASLSEMGMGYSTRALHLTLSITGLLLRWFSSNDWACNECCWKGGGEKWGKNFQLISYTMKIFLFKFGDYQQNFFFAFHNSTVWLKLTNDPQQKFFSHGSRRIEKLK